jgi:hypothetical protein
MVLARGLAGPVPASQFVHRLRPADPGRAPVWSLGTPCLGPALSSTSRSAPLPSRRLKPGPRAPSRGRRFGEPADTAFVAARPWECWACADDPCRSGIGCSRRQ